MCRRCTHHRDEDRQLNEIISEYNISSSSRRRAGGNSIMGDLRRFGAATRPFGKIVSQRRSTPYLDILSGLSSAVIATAYDRKVTPRPDLQNISTKLCRTSTSSC